MIAHVDLMVDDVQPDIRISRDGRRLEVDYREVTLRLSRDEAEHLVRALTTVMRHGGPEIV
ncbi:hypothetical protein P9209_00100 [Prescottella defluvii]|nr:hypothetical protein P9209_00100 [Prescottella defluvii]